MRIPLLLSVTAHGPGACASCAIVCLVCHCVSRVHPAYPCVCSAWLQVPGMAQGRAVSELVEGVDLLPTLLDLWGVPRFASASELRQVQSPAISRDLPPSPSFSDLPLPRSSTRPASSSAATPCRSSAHTPP